MKNFLISINKNNNNASLIEQSKEVQIVDKEDILIVFTGQLKIETLSKAYKKEGIDCLKKLEDSFSCLIYDKAIKQLFIAKDHVGIQPLYFADTEHTIIIGSHLKTFQNIPTFTPHINPRSIGEYLQFGFILQPNTIFKNCHKVCSGEYVCFNLNQNTYNSINYWKLESCYETEKTKDNEDVILKKTDNLLHSIIEESCNNTKFGLSLSGGYDSSTLTAITQTQHQEKIDTFTIGFHDRSIDEAPHAKAIAKHLGTQHHEYYFTDEDAIELIPKMCKIFDEPFADHASTPTILTSQLLQQNNIKNLIAGDGGDEVFATAEDVHAFNRLRNTAMPLRKTLAKSLNSIKIKNIPYLKHYKNLPKKQNKLVELLLAKNIPKMIYNRNTLFMEEELQTHIKEYTMPMLNSFDKVDFYGHAEAVDEVIGTYFKTTMTDGELVKSYSTMNHLDIKLSTPFLNIRLVKHMAQIPSSIKIKNDVKKYLLKEIAHQYIPKQLIDRPKSGFDIPFSSWMRGKLKDILHEQINQKRLDEDNIFYTSSILNIRDKFYAGNDTYKYKLWRILIFQLWYEHFTSTLKNKG